MLAFKIDVVELFCQLEDSWLSFITVAFADRRGECNSCNTFSGVFSDYSDSKSQYPHIGVLTNTMKS